MLKKHGGSSFAVVEPSSLAKAKNALLEFLQLHRVLSAYAPRYGTEDELGSFLRAKVSSLCRDIVLRHAAPDDEC
jgi:hypothetical protein